MRQMYLYKVSNKVNDKLYIGVTFDPKRRWQHHQYESSNCVKLKRALAKYGKESFKFEVVCIGSEEYILDLEAKAIVAYDSIRSGYNTIPGGNRVGMSLEQETKGKISESLSRYYEDNDSPNKGRSVKSRSDDEPICVFGFWFPNRRTAIKTLGMDKKTIYARKAEGTLHLEARPLKSIIRPERKSLEDVQKRSQSMKGKNAGAANGMYGKPNTARSRPVFIEGILYASIREATEKTIYTKSQIEKRIKKGAEGFQYANP